MSGSASSSPSPAMRHLNSAQHAVALLSDDEPRTQALHRFLQQHEAFVSQLRLVVDWYMPALPATVLMADAPTLSLAYSTASSSSATMTAATLSSVASSLLPSIKQHLQSLRPASTPAASAATMTATTVTTSLSTPASSSTATTTSSVDADESLVTDEVTRSLLRLSPAAQLALVFGNIADVLLVAERFADELAESFVVVEDVGKPVAIYRGRRADTDANVDKGNVAVAAALFVDAMADYFAAPFEVFCRNMHRSELMLRLLLKNERFALKVATVRAAYGAASPSLSELLLAPLRQLTAYSRTLGTFLEATPPSDWRERRRLTASLELVNPRLDELMALVLASASHHEMLEIERRLTDHPLGKVALPGRRLVLSAAVEVSNKTPPKWKERFLVLFNDLLVWCKTRGSALVYEAHLELCDAMLYQPSSQGRPVVLQNNTIVQLVNKRERRLRIYSFRCATIHARRRLQTALSQRINSLMASMRHEHEQELERERARRDELERSERNERDMRQRAEAAAAQSDADAKRLVSMERVAVQFIAASETSLRECNAHFCVVETAFSALQSQLDQFADERTTIANLLDGLEALVPQSTAS